MNTKFVLVRRILLSASVVIAISVPASALAQPAISSEIAPHGKLRVGMNAGNPVLIKQTAEGKIVSGVGVDVGKFIAEKLGVSFELVAYRNANTFTQSFGKGEWDIGIGPPIALVAEKADFGPDLLLVDHVYTAAPGQQFADAAQVDRPGVKIGVGKNSAQDLFLSRTLKSAELVRMPGGRTDAIETLRSGKANLWAANATQAQAIAASLPGAKIVSGAFNTERSSVALPKGRSSAAQGKIADIVNEAKRTGIVQRAIDEAGLKGVRVAPN
jgi:polar amino acid transport system substrate-binding protein